MTSAEAWDPLEAAGAADQEVLSAAKKREIKNILKSYVGAYDSFSELLQNAMDAIERRIDSEGGAFGPKIWIKINLQENSLEVIDNGCGFASSEFRSFLAPSISYKSGGHTRGNKGVGVTYIAYGFNDLTIRTKNSTFAESRRIQNGRKWLDDQSGTQARPKAEIVADSSSLFDQIDQGTSFKIYFGGEQTRPKNLGWYQATTPSQWLYLLLLKTPLGYIDLAAEEASDIKFDLIVVDADGAEKSISDCSARYKYPHTEVSASKRLADIVNTQTTAISKGKDPAAAINKFRNSNGIYEYFDKVAIAKELRLDEGDKELLERFDVSAYGYFAYSTEIWDQLNDKKAQLRKGYRVLKGGLQLANNRMPQGELITIPLTKSIGHQNQTHVIVHFSAADPDLGRKGFQPELKELAENISTMIVRKLSARRDILKSDSGAQANIEKELKVHEWLKDQERHEETNPLELDSEKFFLPTKQISIGSVPRSEQDVIVLFNQLIAGGVIRGVKLLSTSQVAQYDGVFRYVAFEPLSNHVFDNDDNPLGVLQEQIPNSYSSAPKILEYKYSLDGLIREFEGGVKSAQDVELAVFWEMGTEYQREFSVVSLLDKDNVHQREHHGITHIFSSGHASFRAICLKELLQLLNEPEEAQKFQAAAYGDGV